MPKHRSTKNQRRRAVVIRGLQDVFQGTTAIYVIEGDGYADFFVGDYEIDATLETWPEQIRANRLRRERRDGVSAKLPRDSLRDQVLIALGPQVSAKQAVAALEKAIQSITADGLLIGTDRAGNIAWEHIDGEVEI